MDRAEWDGYFETLGRTVEVVKSWEPELPDLSAARCEQSKHRTLAHLRACQEQWLFVVEEFLNRENPNVTVLHPWRKFAQSGYEGLPWGEHFKMYVADREKWTSLRERVDWERGGKMNRKPETIGSLTRRLAMHEAHHVDLFD